MDILARSTAALAQETAAHDIAASPLLDRRPLILRADDDAARALSTLLARNAWGAAVLDKTNRYLGLCTLRSLGDLALLVSADSTPYLPSLDYHREDVGAMVSRLASRADTPVSSLLDRTVPVVYGTQSAPQALSVLIRRPPILAVLDEHDRSLLGVVTLDRGLRLLHSRSGIAAQHPA
jgi:hypothetical protein